MTKTDSSPLDSLTLGQATDYVSDYDARLLQPVPRSLNRDGLGIDAQQLPFHGVDIWNGYELSWLNSKGKPCVAILEARVPATSPHIVESKSFKLYLNSLNQSSFPSADALRETISRDLSTCAGARVGVFVHSLNASTYNVQQCEGHCIDDLDISIQDYDYNPELLTTGTSQVQHTLVSHLLKSNCLITNQPDWGSVIIRYEGKEILPESVLRYLITFRQHNEFHEQCVERIFTDIKTHCQPRKLSIYARYTRRGGLDINPFRSDFEAPYANIRLARQ